MELEGSAYECAWQDGYDEGFDAGEKSALEPVSLRHAVVDVLCGFAELNDARDIVADALVEALRGGD